MIYLNVPVFFYNISHNNLKSFSRCFDVFNDILHGNKMLAQNSPTKIGSIIYFFKINN